MSPQRIVSAVRREVALLREDQCLRDAVRQLEELDVPALPVVDARGKLLGIFGEREFIGALFPGYLMTLGYAGFVPPSLDEALEKRATCLSEPVSNYMNTEHIDVPRDASGAQIAETFLHHRVLILPVLDGGRVTGVITRGDFFRAVAQRFLAG